MAENKELEKEASSANNEGVIIFDGMAIVQKIKKTGNLKTCSDFAKVFIDILINESRGYKQIRLIFDRYMKHSLKEQTREKRTKGKVVHFKISDDTKIENYSMKVFLSHIKTKKELTKYLTEKFIDTMESIGKEYVVVYDTICKSNVAVDPWLKSHDHEEADTLIVLYGVDVAKKNPFQDLVVVSPDTDVLLLLIAFYKSLCANTVFKTGKGNSIRYLDVGTMYEALGEERASALLGFHAFTGCDVTCKFYGKSKLTCWKVFMKSSSDVLEAFKELGNYFIDITDVIINGLHEYVFNLYHGSKYQARDISELRWQMYIRLQVEQEMLPPTHSALYYKILRCHYTTQIWRNADKPVPTTSNPCNFGWRKNDSYLEPVLTDHEPFPDVITELTFCYCRKSCVTMRCICKSNSFECTEMCSCCNCENNDEIYDKEELNYLLILMMTNKSCDKNFFSDN